jgi:hypothetical protein
MTPALLGQTNITLNKRLKKVDGLAEQPPETVRTAISDTLSANDHQRGLRRVRLPLLTRQGVVVGRAE